jgi:hypothetical protein
METTKMLTCLGALVACVGAPSLAFAEKSCSGYYVHVGSTEVVLYNEPNWPQHEGIGKCDERGTCTYHDKDFDYWTIQSENLPGTSGKGTFKTVSGTGKYQKLKSSGGWATTRVDVGPEGAIYVGTFTWGGPCKLD